MSSNRVWQDFRNNGRIPICIIRNRSQYVNSGMNDDDDDYDDDDVAVFPELFM
jgi:hypothetical protein